MMMMINKKKNKNEERERERQSVRVFVTIESERECRPAARGLFRSTGCLAHSFKISNISHSYERERERIQEKLQISQMGEVSELGGNGTCQFVVENISRDIFNE
jgi:hypothetical protein